MAGSSTDMIGFFCSSPSWGGLEINVLRLARWLEARRIRVTLLVRENTPLHREALLAGCSVEIIGPHRKYLDLSSALTLRSTLRRLGISTVFVFHRNDMDVMAWVKVFSGPSLTLVFQQHMQLGVSRRDPVHAFRYARYDAWISPLEGLRNEVLAKTRIRPEKIHVIPLGIETNRLDGGVPGRGEARNYFGIPGGGTLFGILGRIETGKGQAFLVKALKRLREKGHDARLLIVGDVTIEPGQRPGTNTYDEELRSLVRSLGLSGVVWLHPFAEDTRLFFRAIDACVMATTSETYGMVTLEAMASGVPVIGTDSGGTTEILGGGKLGMLFRPGDEGDFVRCAETVIRGGYPVEMIAAARARVTEHFSHEKECAMIGDLLRRLRPGGTNSGA
ncbi:MAG TPA: glycosyltransferase family 4 protein [Bacteroidota bacterium]|nr:glycosyltransferase family 4 protein [Bacteroidota bacterium]